MSSPESPPGPAAEKAELRRHYRAVRRAVDDPAARSSAICAWLSDHPAMRSARAVMLFDPVFGEPDLGDLRTRCSERGVVVSVPEDLGSPAVAAAPMVPDVVVVPGVAFTCEGHRLGQGGGWYDRFLATCPSGTLVVGVAFTEQIAPVLPVEAHDRPMDLVVTERGACTPGDPPPADQDSS